MDPGMKSLDDFSYSLLRGLIGFLRSGCARKITAGNDANGVPDIVKNKQALRDHEIGVPDPGTGTRE
jgi:hypothetical protein